MLDRLPQVTIGVANGLAIGGGGGAAVVLRPPPRGRVAPGSRIPEVELDLPLTWQALPRLMRELGPGPHQGGGDGL